MRIGPVLLFVWLTVGAIAAGQRHEFSRSRRLQQGRDSRRHDHRWPAQLHRRESQDLLPDTASEQITGAAARSALTRPRILCAAFAVSAAGNWPYGSFSTSTTGSSVTFPPLNDRVPFKMASAIRAAGTAPKHARTAFVCRSSS